MSHGHGHGGESSDPRDKFDKEYRSMRKEFGEIPRLQFSDEDDEKIRRLKALNRRDNERTTLQDAIAALRRKRTRTPEEEIELQNLEAALATVPELTDEEQHEQRDLDATIGAIVKRYKTESEQELRLAPDTDSFENFSSINEELREAENPIESRRPRHYSVVALEEIRVLLHRLFGRNWRLRTFFEQHVVLRYDPVDHVDDHGGSTITKEPVRGTEKYVVRVSDATFMHNHIWHDRQGREHVLPEFHFVSAAFTIGRALLSAAVNDEELKKFLDQASEQDRPVPEAWLENGAPHRIRREAGGNSERDRALDFLAFYLIDPKQAEKVNSGLAGAARQLLSKISPEQARRLADGQEIKIPQLSLNEEFLYHDYDPAKRPRKFESLHHLLSDEDKGMLARMGIGAGIGYGLGTLTGPVGWLTAAGAFFGAKFTAPLNYFRTLVVVYHDQVSFYRELAIAEHQKKAVAAILDQERSGSDRMAELKQLIEFGMHEDVEHILLSLAKTGDFALWMVQMFLWHGDKLFRQTGGKQITETNYNFINRLHRYSMQSKRVGTYVNMYEHKVDHYGRHTYELKNYDAYQDQVWDDWKTKSERDAQTNVAVQVYTSMMDGEGPIDINAKLGDNLSDPNSRGWTVNQGGDLRVYMGGHEAHEFLEFMQHEFSGDQRYLLKFNAAERGAIQRMQQFKNKFPGEYTMAIAKDMYEHYYDKIEPRDPDVEQRDLEAFEEIEKRDLKDLVEDDSVAPNELRTIAEQATNDTYWPFYPGTDVKEVERISGRGSVSRTINRLQKDFSVLKFRDETSAELAKLLGIARLELAGRWNEETNGTVDDAIEEVIDRVERILADTHTPTEEAFKVRTWITQFQGVEPKVKVIERFCKSLDAELKDYTGALERAIQPGAKASGEVTKALEKLGSIHEQLTTNPTPEALNLARTSVEDIRQTLETYRDLLGYGSHIDQFQALEISDDPREFAQLLGQIFKNLETWSKQAKEHRKLIEAEDAALGRVTTKVEQLMRLRQLGTLTSEEDEQERQSILIDFRSLRAIPDEIKQGDPSIHELYKALKLGTVAVGRKLDEQKAKEREEKKKKKGGD